MAENNIISINFGDDGWNEECDTNEYDQECARIREKNKGYLTLFKQSMETQGLAQSTIHRHMDNVDFFLNEYLLYYGAHEMEYGCHDVYGFLGDFFIRKCMWSTPGTIKTNATSIKKFYKCMRDNGLVSAEACDELAKTIKENMADWQADCAEFNDPGNDPILGASPYGSGLDFGLNLESDFRDIFREVLKEKLSDRLEELMTDDAVKSALEKAESRMGQEGTTTPVDDDPPSREEVIEMFTLALFYLTSWSERIGGKGGSVVRKAWKSADWDALDTLREEGLVSCSNKAKSIVLTDAGMLQAEEFLRALHLEHLT